MNKAEHMDGAITPVIVNRGNKTSRSFLVGLC